MADTWNYRDWKLGGERTTLGNVTLDSTIHCGAGQGFHQVGPNHIRFRARPGLAKYSWRFHFRIESPGDGREIVLEVADFNHFGQELWQEQATVLSRDGEHWTDLGVENISIVPWTPTGRKDNDDSINDGWHPPYGVQYRLRLDAPVLWFAAPTPYTLRHSREHLRALAARCDFFKVRELGPSHYTRAHGFPVLGVEIARPGADAGKLRVVVIAGEHASESAGMYACEGLMEEILRTLDILSDFSFWVVPVANIDGLAYGKSYFNVDPADPLACGVNVGRDWQKRTQPETQAIWRLIEEVRPHCVVNLHNGRHRREFEVCAPPQPQLAAMLRHIRAEMPLPVEHWRPYTEAGALNPETLQAGLTQETLLLETLLLQKLPHCDTFKESYRRTGVHFLRGLVRGLREVHGKPQLLARSETLRARPLRCRAANFIAKLPWFYYHNSWATALDHDIHSFEVNGLPLPPGHYDTWLRMRPGEGEVKTRKVGGKWETKRASEGWTLLSSLPVPARKLEFEFEHKGSAPPFEEALIAPEGTPLAMAQAEARPFERYVRHIRAGEKEHFRNWGPFHARMMAQDFGAKELGAMFDELTAWAARRQTLDAGDPHCGGIWSEEDKFDARDAAAAAACFARQYRLAADRQWLDRALAARRYAYRCQMDEPGNAARHGGFVHMVRGIWGVHFYRLCPPYPGIDGVDTCVIIHLLCRAAELGLPFGPEDQAVLRRAAEWVANSELLPGMFLHHEGATHDCQNASALGLSALVRAYHALAEAKAGPPERWLDAAARGIRHYLEGQEAIGVWPYIFANVGRRGQAFHFDNIPDHGIGLYHLTRVCHRPPLAEQPGLLDGLRRAARWYLGVCRTDGDTIDLEYDRQPDLGGDICFSGFTWCRFTAAATVLRVARLTGEKEPWERLAMRLMEHVRRKRWQHSDPDRAPVVAHARPEAKLATWCQAAEWDASILGEMIEDLGAPAGPKTR